jgi:hypothetical protein
MVILMEGCTIAQAQYFSDQDTLSVVSVSGLPGDTVGIPFDLHNIFAVGGFQIRVTYDSLIFTPVTFELTYRDSTFNLFGSNFGDSGVANFMATSWNPLNNTIFPGDGPITVLRIMIKSQAQPGEYLIEFQDSDSLSHENSLATSRGDTLVIPILQSSGVTVLSPQAIGEENSIPGAFELSQNYPNPFNRTTEILFWLGESGKVELKVYDLLGNVVTTLYSGWAEAGRNIVIWNGRNDNSNDVASGLYFYRLVDASGNAATNQMTLLK